MNRQLVSSLCAVLLVGACASPTQSTRVQEPDEGAVQVGILMLDRVYNSELMAPYDVFQHTVFHASPGMRVFTVGRDKSVVTSFEGLRMLPDYDLDDAPRIDVLVVPSSEHNMDSDLEDERLIEWLKARGTAAGYILSVCDGAFLLAEAGLLDGLQCTTFPGDLGPFRERYPHLAVHEELSFVADGKAITGAGGAISYDPAFYLVEKLYGQEVARRIGQGLVVNWDLKRIPHHIASDK